MFTRKTFQNRYEGKMKAFKICGNVYFVGCYPASSHLIDTGDGLILIDTGYADTLHLLINSIYELGFSAYDIKYIIHTHWHYDHTEGTISLFFKTMDNGITYQVGTFGGTGANTLAKGAFDYDNCRADYRNSLNRLREKQVDVFIGNHVWNNDTEPKGELLLKTGENKFIDGRIWHKFLDFCEKRLDDVIKKEAESK